MSSVAINELFDQPGQRIGNGVVIQTREVQHKLEIRPIATDYTDYHGKCTDENSLYMNLIIHLVVL